MKYCWKFLFSLFLVPVFTYFIEKYLLQRLPFWRVVYHIQCGSKKLDTLKVIFLTKGKTYSNSSNIFLNHYVLVATGEKGNEIIIQIKIWWLLILFFYMAAISLFFLCFQYHLHYMTPVICSLGLVHIEVYAIRYSLYGIRFALRHIDDIQVM